METRTALEDAIPAARSIDLVITQANDEVLVYDQKSHHIHHLNATAAQVWHLCDGRRTMHEIAIETSLTADAVELALRSLDNARLLDEPLPTTVGGTQSRRAFVRKAAIAGTLTLPAVISVSAPAAAQTASCPVITCDATNLGADCWTGGTQGQCGSCKQTGSANNPNYVCSNG